MSGQFLLDTHTFLWWLFDDPSLSQLSRSLMSDRAHRLLVSSASVWEISTKYRIGKLDAAAELVKDMNRYIREAGFEPLSISVEHAQLAGSMSSQHKDPFDRMLAAQSRLENLPLISRDRAFEQLGIECLW